MATQQHSNPQPSVQSFPWLRGSSPATSSRALHELFRREQTECGREALCNEIGELSDSEIFWDLLQSFNGCMDKHPRSAPAREEAVIALCGRMYLA
ncbi:MAG: hypothetical protein ACRYGF_00930, partial [Janthinobacterium lividum]